MAEPSATPGPPGTVPVREVVPDDAPAIAAVHVVSWQKGQAGLRSAVFLAGLSVEDRARHWAVTIDATSRDHLVVVEVEVGGGVAGFAHVGPSRDEYAGPATGELYTLDVTPHAWGGWGIGRALHYGALELLAADGCAAATPWYLGTNRRARTFHERKGWSQIAGVRTQESGDRDYRLPTGATPDVPVTADLTGAGQILERPSQ